MQATGNMARFNRLKNRTTFVFSLLLLLPLPLLLLLPHPLAAQNYLPAEMNRDIARIIDNTVMQRYTRAESLCVVLQQRYPQHPAGYFLHAATLQSKMLDYENYAGEKEFFALTKKVIELAKRDIRKQQKNAWPYFFLGGALGYNAFLQARDGSYWTAFQNGVKTIQALQAVIDLDPQNYDAYLGIGSFKYYRSKFSNFLKFIPILKDERKQGIVMIRQAIEHGRFSRPAALNGLIWIYIEEKNYSEAEQLSEMALQNYPGSRFFLWGKATLAYKQRRWPAAEAAFSEILQSYVSEGNASPYNRMVCHTALAEISYQQDFPEKAEQHARQALAIEVDKKLRKRAKKHRKHAEKILKSLATDGGK